MHLRELFHFTVSSILCKNITTSWNYSREQVCLMNYPTPSHLNYLCFFKVVLLLTITKAEMKHLKPPQLMKSGEGKKKPNKR